MPFARGPWPDAFARDEIARREAAVEVAVARADVREALRLAVELLLVVTSEARVDVPDRVDHPLRVDRALQVRRARCAGEPDLVAQELAHGERPRGGALLDLPGERVALVVQPRDLGRLLPDRSLPRLRLRQCTQPHVGARQEPVPRAETEGLLNRRRHDVALG